MEEFEYYEEQQQGFIRRNIVDFASTLLNIALVLGVALCVF